MTPVVIPGFDRFIPFFGRLVNASIHLTDPPIPDKYTFTNKMFIFSISLHNFTLLIWNEFNTKIPSIRRIYIFL